MRVGSLFAGIGGFDLAASRVWGWDCVRWQVEIDPFAQRVLAKHWPDVTRFSDIRDLTGDELEPVDLICGGFPCQPFSVAGQRLGAADERALWPEMRRVVSLVKPTWVVGENVPGLLNLGLDQVLADLEGAGYECWTLGVPAVAAGAPHRRQRLWILAYSDQERRIGRSGVLRKDGRCEDSHRRQDVADTDREREPQPGRGLCEGRERASDGSEPRDAAHPSIERRGPRRSGRPPRGGEREAEPAHGRVDANADREQAQRSPEPRSERGFWAVEPPVGRVVAGLSGRVDRLRALGNAVVPQIPEMLFRWIAEVECA